MWPFRKGPERTGESGKPSPQEIFLGLRDQALTVRPDAIGLEVEEDEPYGIVTDIGYLGAVVTVVAMGEGTASLYFSTGGGIIGSGQHASVRERALSLVRFAARFTHVMVDATDFELPTVGRVRFCVLTGAGPVAVETSESGLVDPTSPLHPLFAAVHELITEMRLISEQKQKAG